MSDRVLNTLLYWVPIFFRIISKTLSHNVSLRKDIKNEDFWLVESLLAERVYNENSFIFHACFWEDVKDFEQLNTFLENLKTIEYLAQIIDNLKLVIRLGKILLTDHYTVKKYCFVYFKQTIYYNISPKLNGKSLFKQIILRNYSCLSTFKGTSFLSTIILVNINVCKNSILHCRQRHIYIVLMIV